jgi:hypothetical protein
VLKLTTHADAVTVPDLSQHRTGLLPFLYFEADEGIEAVAEVLLLQYNVGLTRLR